MPSSDFCGHQTCSIVYIHAFKQTFIHININKSQRRKIKKGGGGEQRGKRGKEGREEGRKRGREYRIDQAKAALIP